MTFTADSGQTPGSNVQQQQSVKRWTRSSSSSSSRDGYVSSALEVLSFKKCRTDYMDKNKESPLEVHNCHH